MTDAEKLAHTLLIRRRLELDSAYNKIVARHTIPLRRSALEGPDEHYHYHKLSECSEYLSIKTERDEIYAALGLTTSTPILKEFPTDDPRWQAFLQKWKEMVSRPGVEHDIDYNVELCFRKNRTARHVDELRSCYCRDYCPHFGTFYTRDVKGVSYCQRCHTRWSCRPGYDPNKASMDMVGDSP
jgi:hypothetical protein